MIRKLLLLSVLIHAGNTQAAKKLEYWSIAFNNVVTAKPFSGFPKLFYTNLHPGLTVSTGFTWKDKPKHSWNQSFKAGYFSHRYIQRAITLYSEFGYRYKAGKRLGLTAAIGAGYLHMIPAEKQFRMNDNGDWEPIKMRSRPQAMISLSLGVDYKINEAGNRVFIRYQNLLQTPFVPGYVPLLPYNVLHLGCTFPVAQLKKGGKNA